MNKIQMDILRKLMHNPGLSFNLLWDKLIPSNKFSYHVKTLEKETLIENNDCLYFLTHEGKKFVANIDGKSGDIHKFPLSIAAVLVIKNNKILMKGRTKEPFYGYWGFAGGKIKFNQYILEAAKEELKEETGLEADLTLKGLFCSKTYNNNKQSYNHQIFLIKGENPRGELIKEDREGRNVWVDLDKVNSLKIYPDVPNMIKVVLQDKFTLIEIDRYQENDEFKKIDIISETKF